MVAKGWSEAQKKAYVIADNKLALNAGWDLELLAVELGDLQGFDFDLMLTGFSDDELSKLLAEKTDGLTDPDDIPDVPIDPIAKPGDVWLLGKHTSAAFDGSAALSFAATLANSGVAAGTYLKVTVDAKGRVTAASAMTSGDVTGALGYTPANKAGERPGCNDWLRRLSCHSECQIEVSKPVIGSSWSRYVQMSGFGTFLPVSAATVNDRLCRNRPFVEPSKPSLQRRGLRTLRLVCFAPPNRLSRHSFTSPKRVGTVMTTRLRYSSHRDWIDQFEPQVAFDLQSSHSMPKRAKP